MAVQIDGRGDRLVAEPAGNLGGWHTFAQSRAGERVPQVVERGVWQETGYAVTLLLVSSSPLVAGATLSEFDNDGRGLGPDKSA
jgi:hypothetical protein